MTWVAVFKSSHSISSEQFESLEAARAKYPHRRLRQLRVCTQCHHPECPCCQDSCDTIIETGDDFHVCCDAVCAYEQAEPFADDEPRSGAVS
jgi:hypothetical protein